MHNHPKVIIVTGPPGAGKTTLTNLLAKRLNIKRISGDEIKANLFPDIGNITEFPEVLQTLKKQLLKECQQSYFRGESVILDYVILGEAYIKSFQKEFRENLIFIVLLPSKKTIYVRDENRECWTTGRETIDQIHQKYLDLINIIGEKNYLQNEGENIEATIENLIQIITPKQN